METKMKDIYNNEVFVGDLVITQRPRTFDEVYVK